MIAEFQESELPPTQQPHAPDRLMVIHFTFTNDFTQDELLDRISDFLKVALEDADFRRAMAWDKPRPAKKPETISADDYARPSYADYVGRPEAFQMAKKDWRRRMTMLGFDPDLIG